MKKLLFIIVVILGISYYTWDLVIEHFANNKKKDEMPELVPMYQPTDSCLWINWYLDGALKYKIDRYMEKNDLVTGYFCDGNDTILLEITKTKYLKLIEMIEGAEIQTTEVPSIGELMGMSSGYYHEN